MSKQPIPQSLRNEVFSRDGYTCLYCGNQEFLSIDHVVAESKGGPLVVWNLLTSCRSCNSRKGASDLSDFLNDKHRVSRMNFSQAAYGRLIARLKDAAEGWNVEAHRLSDECLLKFGKSPMGADHDAKVAA